MPHEMQLAGHGKAYGRLRVRMNFFFLCVHERWSPSQGEVLEEKKSL
jgi:hypothetical protein